MNFYKVETISGYTNYEVAYFSEEDLPPCFREYPAIRYFKITVLK